MARYQDEYGNVPNHFDDFCIWSLHRKTPMQYSEARQIFDAVCSSMPARTKVPVSSAVPKTSLAVAPKSGCSCCPDDGADSPAIARSLTQEFNLTSEQVQLLRRRWSCHSCGRRHRALEVSMWCARCGQARPGFQEVQMLPGLGEAGQPRYTKSSASQSSDDHSCGDQLCSICFEDDGRFRAALHCQHRFHVGCILEWLQSKQVGRTCPICRTTVGGMEVVTTNN